MKNRKDRFIRDIAAFFLLSLLGGLAAAAVLSSKKTPAKEIAAAADEDAVLVGGMPIGIYLETDGVMVLGTEFIKDKDGSLKSPAGSLVKKGDYIIEVDDRKLHNKKELMYAVENCGGRNLSLKLRRDGKKAEAKVTPAKNENGKYMLGIWVRDSAQGMGTITFLTKNSRFGSLGHGIHDMDTNRLIEISKGSVYKTSIHMIDKGKQGDPGSMEGIIVYNNFNRIGSISKNTDEGVFGVIDRLDEVFPVQESIKIAKKGEARKGKALMRCFVNGDIGEYEIKIVGVDYSGREKNRGMVIEVTDKRLLENTGGIVKGMSGAPILQDGKLVGAVTHVFVNDPAKGYGIFAETMLEEAA